MIRKAVNADAAALASFAAASFRATFGAANSEADMARHCRDSYGAAIQAAEIADPAMLSLLAEEAGELVGYAQLRSGPAPACVTARRPCELQRLYVAAAWQGRGIARELMASALAAAPARGADLLWLGVWEHNPRALAFYRKHGFVAVGEHVFRLGSDAQRDIVMQRVLAPPGGG